MWTKESIQQRVDGKIQESITLDYKSSDSLQPLNEVRKKELIKDISAFANSAGGVIIYAVKEKKDEHGIPVPETIDEGINPITLSREQLEQIITSNSRPRIDGLKIFQVPLGGERKGRVSYVVEIPQSTTAHQALDGRYYKRLGTTTTWMAHYEIMDVLGRTKTAQLEIIFRIARHEDNGKNKFALFADVTNVGIKVIQNIAIFIGPVPGKFFARIGNNFKPHRDANVPHLETVSLFSTSVLFPTQEVTFVSPDDTDAVIEFKDVPAWYKWQIPWKLFADDMNPKFGAICIKDLLPPN